MTPRRQRKLAQPSRVLLIIGVVVFLALDALLIGYALTRSEPDGATPRPLPIPTFGVTPTPSPTPTAEPLPEASPRLMVSVDGTSGWRSTRGACPGGAPLIERTDDGGASWTQTTIGGVALHGVLALSSASSAEVDAVGRVNSGCDLDVLASFTGGDFWNEYPERAGEFSYIDPTAPAVVTIEGSPVDSPCPTPLDLRTGDDSVIVLCNDSLFERPDGSTEWAPLTAPGVLAVTPNEVGGFTVASAGVEGCTGVAVQTLPSVSAETGPILVGCIPDAALDGVTLAQSGTTVWLWAGDRVWVSPDGGASWS